jgi:ATP-binding cassette subfamily C (CFTR/MRP) protein 1
MDTITDPTKVDQDPVFPRQGGGYSLYTEYSLAYILYQVLSTLSAALRLVCLVLWCKNPVTAYSIAGSSVTLVIAIGIAFLLLVEHQRLVRPSSFISLYFLCRIIADSVQLRTLLLRGYANTISWVLLAELVVQAVFLFLESWPRRKYVSDSKEYSPEDTAGIFNRSVLWWLNSLFWLGNGTVLQQSDLFSLDVSIRSSILRKRMLPIWEKCLSLLEYIVINCLTIADKTSKHALVRTLLSSLFVPWLHTIPPKACTIALQYSQTFLLSDAVNYLAKPAALQSKNDAYGLIGAAVLIYFGMAVCLFFQIFFTAAYLASRYRKQLRKENQIK